MRKKEFELRLVRKKLSTIGFVLGLLVLVGCGESSDNASYGEETEVIVESTKGVITELEEIEPGDDFLIVDEQIIEDQSQSIAIVHYLDGRIDTVSLVALEADQSYSDSNRGLRNVLMYSLAAAVLTRNFGAVNPNSAAYKSNAAFNKSSGLHGEMKRTTTTRTVSSPKSGSKGYGSNRSFRSSGG